MPKNKSYSLFTAALLLAAVCSAWPLFTHSALADTHDEALFLDTSGLTIVSGIITSVGSEHFDLSVEGEEIRISTKEFPENENLRNILDQGMRVRVTGTLKGDSSIPTLQARTIESVTPDAPDFIQNFEIDD